MSKRSSFCHTLVALLIVLVLLVPILTACGNNDNDNETTIPPATTPASTTPVATTPVATTALPTSDEPVKIGAIMDWSGPAAQAGFLADAAFKFAEWYYNEVQGGINVGGVLRPIQFVKYDQKNQMALAAAGATKLVTDDKVSAVILGGVAVGYGYPVADVTDPAKTLYVPCFSDLPLFTDYEWTVAGKDMVGPRLVAIAKVIVEQFKPKTVGFIATNLSESHDRIAVIKSEIAKLDPNVKVVYEQYVDATVTDYSPYLTKIRYENPDVLDGFINNVAWTNIAKQIMEQGGWRDIKVLSENEAALIKGWEKTPGMNGVYVPSLYVAGMGGAGAAEFTNAWAKLCEQDSNFKKTYSLGLTTPSASLSNFMFPIQIVIEAVKLAGTDDPAKIAEAGRSGKIAFESVIGPVKIGTDGTNNVITAFYQMSNGQLIPVTQ